MLWLYNIAILFYGLIVKFYSLFDNKASQFINGRKNIFEQIAKCIDSSEKHIWFHFASLGEFEQGRSVIEGIKQVYPYKKIVVTFFSPSGYEIRKNYALAEAVFYLPLDTASNAKKLVELFNPEVALFTKYEFWFHYFKSLSEFKTPLILISGIFRPNQAYFKWFGFFNRKILKYVDHFFVQNQESFDLLKGIGITRVTISGDTRFDRVAENALISQPIEQIEQFVGSHPTFVAGSTWPADEMLISKLIAFLPDWKFIIAPHEIHAPHLENLLTLLPEAKKFSEWNNTFDSQTLIIDNIGMLSSLYRYGRLAYIGGGFGTGIHNTLEAAAFGIPVIFGPNYSKFQEAKDLVEIGAGSSISNEGELLKAFNLLTNNDNPGIKAKEYVAMNTGATSMIMKYLEDRF